MTLFVQKDYSLKEALRPKLKITIHWTSLIMILLLVSGIDIWYSLICFLYSGLMRLVWCQISRRLMLDEKKYIIFYIIFCRHHFAALSNHISDVLFGSRIPNNIATILIAENKCLISQCSLSNIPGSLASVSLDMMCHVGHDEMLRYWWHCPPNGALIASPTASKHTRPLRHNIKWSTKYLDNLMILFRECYIRSLWKMRTFSTSNFKFQSLTKKNFPYSSTVRN